MPPRRPIDAPQPSRVAILRAARALVLKHGHERVSLREVARKAGFSAPSLYEYFDGKAAILRELAEASNTALRRALEDGVARADEPRARLVELGMAYVGFARDHAEDFLLLFSRMPSKRRSTAEAVPPRSAFEVVIAAVTAAAPLRKGAPAIDVEIAAYGLWATVHGMAQLQLTHLAGFAVDFPKADRAVLEALVSGLLYQHHP